MQKVLALFLSLSLAAAEAEVRKLSLNDALASALQKNFGYRIAEGNWSIAKAEKTRAAGALLPSVSTSLFYDWTKRGPSSPYTQGLITIPRSNRTTTTANYSLGLSVHQTVFDGGASFSNFKARAAAEDASKETFRGARQSLIFDVKKAYFSALKTKKNLEVKGDVLKRGEEQLKIAQARYDLGSASLSDVLKAKVEFGTAQLDLIAARSDYQATLATLNSTLGDDVNDSLELSDELTKPESLSLSYEEALLKAEKNHPDLITAEKNLEASEWGLQASRAGLFPSLSMNAGYGWNNRDFSRVSSLFDRDYQWNFGFSISYNIFDRFSTYSSIKRAQAEHSNARESFLKKKSEVALEVKNAFLNLAKAQQSVELADKRAESAEEDLNIMQEKYKLGAATFLELLDAQTKYKDAKSGQTGEVQALFDYNMAITGLKKAVGEE